jgi:hypothetical protein
MLVPIKHKHTLAVKGFLGTPEHINSFNRVFLKRRREDVDGECLAVARGIYTLLKQTHACGGRLFCIPTHIATPSSAFQNEQHTRISQIWAFQSSIFHKCTRNIFGCAEKADKHLAFWGIFFFFEISSMRRVYFEIVDDLECFVCRSCRSVYIPSSIAPPLGICHDTSPLATRRYHPLHRNTPQSLRSLKEASSAFALPIAIQSPREVYP